MAKSAQKGFTLVELLVVISIIAILSVIGMTVFSGVQRSARNSKRISDMKAIVQALEIYYNDPVNNFQYPSSSGKWRSECPDGDWGGYTSDQVIPGLVPKYMVSFPSDPQMDKTNSKSCYLYQSNGTDYALLDHDIPENNGTGFLDYKAFVDPYRDGGAEGYIPNCKVDGPWIWAWKMSSPGGRCW